MLLYDRPMALSILKDIGLSTTVDNLVIQLSAIYLPQSCLSRACRAESWYLSSLARDLALDLTLLIHPNNMPNHPAKAFSISSFGLPSNFISNANLLPSSLIFAHVFLKIPIIFSSSTVCSNSSN